jgi:hypothetical protein
MAKKNEPKRASFSQVLFAAIALLVIATMILGAVVSSY